ncbi:PAS domain S-box protein [Aquimonas voraii]|uniref:histidine kinase n=1 Tax=Aquimonas voraii TaxID=265719 RepID=A0A1G6U0B5_9GAMM|nr:PAS domain S-box protein [Aquimonas voraii]SDD33985.1 PAS domain S-box-containing protein [Aquimonas voraii]
MRSELPGGAPLPDNEAERLRSLRVAELLDTEAEAVFDDLTRLAASICGTPISLLSLVDEHRQWFKSRVGLDATETPRELAFCAHAILGDAVMEVPDAREDPRFRNNPLVTDAPAIRLYAGAPLQGPGGYPIGTLCVIDTEPRSLTPSQREQLATLAALGSHLIEARLAQKRAERGERALAQLLEALPDGVVACNAQGELSHFNGVARAWHGCDPMRVPQSEWAERFDLYEADGETRLSPERIPLVRAYRGETLRDVEFCIRARGQSPRFVLASGGPVRDTWGNTEGAQVVMHDITQRRHAQLALEEERRRLAMVLEGTRAGTWEWNVQTGETRFNARWAEIVGYTLEELAPISIQTWLDLAHPDDLPGSEERLQAHFRGEAEQYDFVCRMRHKAGHWVWVHDRGRVMSRNAEGQPLWMAGTHIEVSELRRTQERMEQALAQLQSIVAGALDVSIIATDVDGTIRLFSPGAERLLGYRAEDMIGHCTPAIFHDPEEVQARARELSQREGRSIEGFDVFVDAARRDIVETRQWTYIRRDGGRRQVRLCVSAIRDPAGRPNGFVGIAIDLTELTQETRARVESEDRFAGAFRASALGLALVAPDGRFLQVNPALCNMLGYSAEELLSGDFQQLTHPDDLAIDLELVRQSLAGKLPGYQLRKRYITRQGATVWAMLAVSLVRGSEGQPLYFVSQVLDITTRVRAEEALRASEAKLSELFRLSPVGIALKRMEDGAFLEANPEFYRMLGYSEERFRRLSYWDITPIDYEALERVQLGKLQSLGRYGPYEKEYLHADGHRIPVLLHGVRFQPGGSGEVLILSVVQDISERKRLERIKSEFVSTVSHELRTPLTSISGALDLVVGGALGQLPNEAHDLLQLAQRNARRLGSLVGDLLDLEKLLAGKISLNKSLQNLGGLLVDTVAALQPYAERFDVKVQLHAPPDVQLNTDPGRFSQILTNLISNAIKFSPRAGLVEIQALLVDEAVELQVLDRGRGVPEAFRDQLFQSFAQAEGGSDRSQEGTGLGLAISRELTGRLGGDIGYRPREGGGSCFWLRLPVMPTTTAAQAIQPTPSSTRPCVLVVEDDPDMAAVIELLLEREGFDSLHADSMESAKTQLAKADVQAITLDLSLGEERGEDLLEWLRGTPETADLPVLVVSGHADRLPALDPNTARMQKPLRLPALTGALHTLIGRRASREHTQILCVEDDEDSLKQIAAALRPLGEITFARNLAQARVAIQARRFDLVVLDLVLPDGDGRTLLPLLPKDPAPPVLVFSEQALSPDATLQFAAVLGKAGTPKSRLADIGRLLLSQPSPDTQTARSPR